MSTPAPVVNVDELIDKQPLSARSAGIFALLLIALLCDGFDLQLLSFAAPDLIKDWGISRPALGPVFSANLFGMMIGAIVLGSLGDRFGRKRIIVTGTFLYSLSTLACLATDSLWELAALRFLTGVGLGGVLPNVIALSAELTARRVRALVTSLVVIGMSLGSSATGYVSRMMADHGWQGLFLVGAAVPFVIGVLLLLALPESLPFLARSPQRRATLARRARVIDPSLQIGPDTQFVLRHRELQEKPGVGRLFSGELAVTTPALWLLFAGTLLSMYLMTSWMPTLFEMAGLSRSDAAGITSLFHLGGVFAGLLTAFLLGVIGLPWILILLALGGLGVAAIAITGFERDMLTVFSIVAGFGIVGCQNAINASAGLIYPSAIRPTGVGAALGVGRTGSIIGPSVGAIFLAAGLSTQHMFYLPLIPIALAILGVAILVIRRVDIRSGADAH